MRTLQKVEVKDLRELWGYARRFIMAAADTAGEMGEEDIVSGIALSSLHLFIVWEGLTPLGAFTMQVQEYPKRRVAQMVHLGGWLKELAKFLPQLERWAREQECEVLRAHTIESLAEKGKPYGFKLKYQVLEKEI